MWCANCHADVAGEVSQDAKSLLCTTCGSEVSSIKTPGPLPNARGARDLLERWNTEEILDPYQPGKRRRITESADNETVTETTTEVASEREARVARRPSQRRFRVDDPHGQDDGESAAVLASPSPRDVAASHGRRVDASHTTAPPPHFNIEAAFDDRRKPGRGESLWGQLLAYAGVGVLTVGTGLVVWGYFGGPESYTPTGWLLATAGQMLLFLGVVTLISGGMEQTTHEVTQRIERLGDHILRIERHTADQALRGPHVAMAAAADRPPAATVAAESTEKSAG